MHLSDTHIHHRWKKYLTSIQLIQFAILAMLALFVLHNPSCNINLPWPLTALGWTSGLLLIYGFVRFYIDTYIKRVEHNGMANVCYSPRNYGQDDNDNITTVKGKKRRVSLIGIEKFE